MVASPSPQPCRRRRLRSLLLLVARREKAWVLEPKRPGFELALCYFTTLGPRASRFSSVSSRFFVRIVRGAYPVGRCRDWGECPPSIHAGTREAPRERVLNIDWSSLPALVPREGVALLSCHGSLSLPAPYLCSCHFYFLERHLSFACSDCFHLLGSSLCVVSRTPSPGIPAGCGLLLSFSCDAHPFPSAVCCEFSPGSSLSSGFRWNLPLPSLWRRAQCRAHGSGCPVNGS